MIEFLTTLSGALNDIPTMSPSQIAKWHDCRKAWHYSYRQDLRKINQNTFFMDRGTYFHRLLHFYYHLMQAGFKAGDPALIEAMKEKIEEDLEQLDEDNVSMLATTIPHFDSYVRTHSPKIDRGIKVVGVEMEIYVPKITPKGRYIFLHGFIDLVYRNSYGRLMVKDHKTGERVGTWSNGKVNMELQLYLYELCIRYIFNEPVEGVEINFVNLAKKPEKRFETFEANHSEVQIAEFERELLILIDEILDENIIRRYNKDCEKCSYVRICTLEQQGLNPAAVISTMFERSHRKSNVNQLEPRFKRTESVPIEIQRQPSTITESNVYSFDLSGLNLNVN